jgi:ATP/maltotriose-dependent transcriptional regulator MalT
VTNYLVSEVLNQQSTDLREFLLQISILNRFNADLSDAVFYHYPSETGTSNEIGKSCKDFRWYAE